MVWDTLHRRAGDRREPIEAWGGIAYSLATFETVAPGGWTLLPIVKVGRDLYDGVRNFLERLERVRSLEGVRRVPETNNRVDLYPLAAGRRCERLTGGVPGWKGEELAALTDACDALYINFIAGWELDLAGARALRERFRGPMYCDLHSLLLGVGRNGVRELRPLDEWRDWLACFDVVQMNEEELHALVGSREDPLSVVARVVGRAPRALLVTRGAYGAAWLAPAGFGARSREEWGPRAGGESGPVERGEVAIRAPIMEADPIGCGDVWGMTCFAHLLGGAILPAAMERANEVAARNAAGHGAARLLGPAAASEA